MVLRRLFGRKSTAESTLGSASAREPEVSESFSSCWRSTELAGRPAEIFEPPGSEDTGTGVVYLHSYSATGLAENQAFTREFARRRLRVVVPHGGPCWWMDRICDEFDSKVTSHDWLLNKLIPALTARWGVSPPGIGLLGISMGGQGVLQFAFRNARSFPVVAAIAPTVDFDQLYGAGTPLDRMFSNREAARQATVVLNIHMLDWPRWLFFCCDPEDSEWFDGVARLGMKLSSSGILHERDLVTSASGHTWDYFNRMAPTAVNHLADCLTKVVAASE